MDEYSCIAKSVNPISRYIIYFGQLSATAYLYTIEHFLVGFKAKIRVLQKRRAERFKDAMQLPKC